MPDPPDHAWLCCDEKSQIPGLDRTQPGLFMKPARAGTMTLDYRRNRTARLFAALSLDGKVIGVARGGSRGASLPKDAPLVAKRLHLVGDNYATYTRSFR